MNLSLATSETWRDKASGERKEKTEWHRVVIFNKNLAKVAEKYLRKGAKVYLEGSAADPQMDRQGRRRRNTRPRVVLQNFRGELTMLDSKGEGGGGSRGAYGAGGAAESPASFERGSDMDDEIPF